MNKDLRPVASILEGGSYYWFCLYSIVLNNTMQENREHYEDMISFKLGTQVELRQYHDLMEKFNVSIPHNNSATSALPSGVVHDSRITLSFQNISSLLSIINGLSVILLSDKADELISIFSSRFRGINKDWVKGFFKNGEYFFSLFKERFKDDKDFDEVLKTITSDR